MKVKAVFFSLAASVQMFMGYASYLEATPVQKVITLLSGMLEKGKEEKKQEQVLFEEENAFCTKTQESKGAETKKQMQNIENMKASIEKYSADAAHLVQEITKLEQSQDAWNGDIKAATKVRAMERADYDTTHKDYSESILAIQGALEILKKQQSGRNGQSASLAQLLSSKHQSIIPAKAKEAIDLFLQQQNEDDEAILADDAESPGASAQTTVGIVEMLEKLEDKFVDERITLEKEETNAQHTYALLMKDLQAQIDEAAKQAGAKTRTKAKALESKAGALQTMQQEEAAHGADSKFASELDASCKMKAADFKSRQALRAEEISTIEKALAVLSGDAVAGNAAKHLETSPTKMGSSLGQLRTTSNIKNQDQVVDFLRARARELNSRVLAAVAGRAAADPFEKVRKMIKDLVVRLLDESNQEADHKGWCDEELSTNEKTRKDKTALVETLHAEVDELHASIAKVTEEITDLSKSTAEIDAKIAEQTKLRGEEKAQNTATIQDAHNAQAAITQALTMLSTFYVKAAKASAFLQQPYTGMSTENEGVTGFLEVVGSDFARLECDTKAAENTAQKTYDDFMSGAKVNKATKETSAHHKKANLQDYTQALAAKKLDLEGVQQELTSALEYFDKLKPSCVNTGTSYEERVERRKEEIKSLQEALNVMNGSDLASDLTVEAE